MEKEIKKKNNSPNQTDNIWWRPLKFKTVEELQKKIDDYFESCFEYQWTDELSRDKDWKIKTDENWKHIFIPKKIKVMIKIPTVTGLAVALKTSRQTLINYESNENFFDTIKVAKSYIESLIEQWALMNELNPTSAIFNLKNNFDWKDKSEVDNNINWKLEVNSTKDLTTEELLRLASE